MPQTPSIITIYKSEYALNRYQFNFIYEMQSTNQQKDIISQTPISSPPSPEASQLQRDDQEKNLPSQKSL